MVDENLGLTKNKVLLIANKAFKESLKNEHIHNENELESITRKINIKIEYGKFEACFKNISKSNEEILKNCGYKITSLGNGFSVSWDLMYDN